MTTMDMKKIAQAVLDGQRIREESYLPSGETFGPEYGALEGTEKPGEYIKTDDEAIAEACNKNGLPREMEYLLHLAWQWGNDLEAWARAVLDDKYAKLFIEPDSNKKQSGKKKRPK